MNADEYTEYKTMTCEKTPAVTLGVVNVGERERTLAYGYTCDRDTWHAYVMGGELHVITYVGGSFRENTLIYHEHAEWIPVEQLRPNKRVYPDTVDPLFARLMFDCDAELPFIGNFDFTAPDAVRRQGMGPFKGKTHLDF